MFIKTDDLQYVNKLKDGVYRCLEARYAEDKYLLCTDKIIIPNWLDSDGNYDSDCRDVITSFYGTIEEFECNYEDEEYREQVLAEMLFESIPYYNLEEYRTINTVDTDIVNDALFHMTQEYKNH